MTYTQEQVVTLHELWEEYYKSRAVPFTESLQNHTVDIGRGSVGMHLHGGAFAVVDDEGGLRVDNEKYEYIDGRRVKL